MIYLCAGIYAEGPTDERFLCKLVDRLLHGIAHDICLGQFIVEDTRAIQEPKTLRRQKVDRETRIAAAIEHTWQSCTLFVIHSDADGDQEKALRERVHPGIERARQSHPDLAAAACIPVWTTEAWMLADPDAFQKIFERPVPAPLPLDVEAVRDPKTLLKSTLQSMGVVPGRGFEGYEALLGDHVRLESLQRLSAFREFESNLRAAVELLARHAHA
jgi:hypothetical protein